MILLSSNKPKQLLLITFIGNIDTAQCVAGFRDAAPLLAELQPGFRVLADLTPLASMSTDCATEIAKAMDLCAQRGVAQIVRVIPDPSKDIGFSILSRFHYPHKPRTIVCETLAEAAERLHLT